MVTQKEEKEKTKTKRTEMGKYFYDLRKAAFSITFLGSLAVMFKDGTVSLSMLVCAGIGVGLAVMSFFVGYKILNK